MKMKEKQKKRKAYEPKLTQEELMDSSTFKRFLASIDNILENLEDVDFTTMGKYQCWYFDVEILNGTSLYFVVIFVLCFFSTADDDEIPQEMLLGKHQLNELGSESAKIKAMGISSRVLQFINIKTCIKALWIFDAASDCISK